MNTGLYLHIPFCAKRCPYCDFAFVVRKHPPFERFTQAMVRELESAAPERAETIYLGGGTPSLLPPANVETILSTVQSTADCETTLEANPEDAERFEALGALGINRLSLGVQSLSDTALRTLGRIHDAATAEAAVRSAVQTFGNVSADLIFGIPGQATDELLESARVLVGEGVRHVSAYGLTVHEGTLLAKDQQHGRFQQIGDEAERGQFLALHDYLTSAGFEHYEVSNYALPGYRSRHNERYWLGKSYRGFGPSAHSYDPALQRRYWNERRLDRWMALLEKGESPIDGEETLDADAVALESLYLGLRRKEGVSLALLSRFDNAAGKADRAVEEGLAKVDGGRLFLTTEGMAVADTLVHHLL